MLALTMKHFCYYPAVFQIKCVFEKKFLHVCLNLNNFNKVVKCFDKLAL